jgi:HEAT repeat protein
MTCLTITIRAARRLFALAALGATTAAAPSLGAQSLASRVTAAGDGEVRMSYATRAGVCGDGRNVVALNHTLYVYPSMESHGRWSGVQCEHGRARVAITTSGGQVERVRTFIGGNWPSGSGKVIDLGTVSVQDVVPYFFALTEKLDGRSARNALLPAVIADSVDVLPQLLRTAQNGGIARAARTRAVHWLGELGDESMVKPLEQLASADVDDDGLGEAALFALSELPDGVGIPSLLRFARADRDSRVRGKAVFWLGQSDDKRARSEVRAIAQDNSLPDAVREKAIFVIGQHDGASDDDVAFLKALFPKLESTKLRDQVLFSISQTDNASARQWLMSIARDESVPVEVRKKAIFWAGQSGAPIKDLAALYDALQPGVLKEHMIFVLSQRDERAATDKLLAIVRDNSDSRMRKKALFWLAQKDDPEITKVISNLVSQP